MATDRTGREDARARLVRMAGPQSAEGGWVPPPPAVHPPMRSAEPVAAQLGAPNGDVSEVAGSAVLEGRAIRQRALDSAITAYTAAHGHPLDHPDPGGEPVVRRWATRARVVVAAALVLAATSGVVVARAFGQLPATLVQSSDVDAGAESTAAAGGSTPDAEPSAVGSDGGGEGADGIAALDGARSEAGTGGGDRGQVIVHVVGQVSEPGLVSLAAGARVADAIEAAGGATGEADLAALNLARVLTDGEQVLIPRPGEQVPGAVGAGATAMAGTGAGGSSGVIDLNGADVVALDALPGIGPVLAQRIIDWRTEHGRFTAVDELGEVTGIGPAVLADLRDLVRV